MSSAKKGFAACEPQIRTAPVRAGWFSAGNGYVIALLVLCLVLFFYKLGGYPLFDLDEPRYAEAAREMLARGDWITPYFNDEVRFDKPVFFYWLIALAYKALGVSEFSARFFSAVAATLSVLGVYAFGASWISPRYGFFSALTLATSVLFIGLARMSITDMTLSLWMTGTTLCLFLAAHRHPRWWLAAGCFAGLGVLTKGPVAIAVPGGIFAVYTLFVGNIPFSEMKGRFTKARNEQRRSESVDRPTCASEQHSDAACGKNALHFGNGYRWWFNRYFPMALGICLAIALPWYALAYQANGNAFLEALFMHNVTRFSDVVSGHKQPVYFYGLVLLAGLMPWTAFLPAAVRQLQLRAKTHRMRVRQADRPYLISLYAAIWTVFVLLFFTVSHTKLLTYILPLFPALALWIGEVFHAKEAMPMDSCSWRWLTRPMAAWILIALLVGATFVFRMDLLLPREAAGVSGTSSNVIAVMFGVLGMMLAAWQLRRRLPFSAVWAQAFGILLILTVALHDIVPNVSQAAQGVMLHYLRKSGGDPLVLYEIQRPSLTFYGKRRVPRFVEEQRAQLLAELALHPRTCVIARNTDLAQFKGLLPGPFHVSLLEKGAVYSLLAVRKAP